MKWFHYFITKYLQFEQCNIVCFDINMKQKYINEKYSFIIYVDYVVYIHFSFF